VKKLYIYYTYKGKICLTMQIKIKELTEEEKVLLKLAEPRL